MEIDLDGHNVTTPAPVTITEPHPCKHPSGIVYVITCTRCRKQYVGLTVKSLRERIN
uniref:GIY-YIG domain-containing protein n=1 Tax=Amphimedon queenslandica TaxID=400682 RepID=A0A1X7U6J1_AMPQE